MGDLITFPAQPEPTRVPSSDKPMRHKAPPGSRLVKGARDRGVLIQALQDMMHSAVCDFITGPGHHLCDEAFVEMLAVAEGRLLATSLDLALGERAAFRKAGEPTIRHFGQAFTEEFEKRVTAPVDPYPDKIS